MLFVSVLPTYNKIEMLVQELLHRFWQYDKILLADAIT